MNPSQLRVINTNLTAFYVATSINSQAAMYTRCYSYMELLDSSRGRSWDIRGSLRAAYALSTLATIVAEFGDYSRPCGQGFKLSK